MSSLHDLIATITKDPQLAFVQRTESCYEKFLQLYEDVGYAPVQPEAVSGWRKDPAILGVSWIRDCPER